MRTMLKLQIPVEAGNDAIRNGRIAEVVGSMMSTLKPEAAYFGAEDGLRTAYFVFDLADSSQIPVVAEPLFLALNARVHFAPVMNAEELQAGLSQASIA